jgi:hypothetical protein
MSSPSESQSQPWSGLALEARGQGQLPIRVERLDGTVVDGQLSEVSASALSVYVDNDRSAVQVPFDKVRRLWAPVVLSHRYQLYLASCALIGFGVVILSRRLADGPLLAGVLLGIAAALAALLCVWLPPVRSRIVVWKLRYARRDA